MSLDIDSLKAVGVSLEDIAIKFGDEVALDFEHVLDTKRGSTYIKTANSKSRDTTE